ncbi:RarD protein [Saprolegnia parasitica CBS 223.65]|uniref:RarD protein n=1 Tax=Saprolegnia parasitica (strain CBS 223.65) TaxID=695850 RepID=A0A067CCX7_SAPPC|nr:RarD protein [Saprolegnia parasitica CBS 223.65]KDO28609.1 RarD protein [Saprolegnia parasitica CBS 223.65]|eukprot:XP_012200672.1 RarD protein [Saprolegnia parasitica CBS 223.65]
MNTGILYCVTAYVVWGVLPIYWKQLEAVPADQLALHRIVWSFVFLLIVLAIKGEFTALRQEARGWRVFAVYTISSVVILANWMTYIWAVNAGYIVQTSLGYFITPLINVIIGVVVFKEKLRLWQWLAIGAAFAGVLVVAIAYGKFPWVALTLAISFSIYGVVKKQAPLNALHGMTVETGILFVPAVIYLSVVQAKGDGAFLHVSTTDNILIVGAGIVTVVPLLMYASAAQKIPFSLLGMLQYIAPSLMFIMGVAVYNEAFSLVKLIGFILVWVALAVYSVEGFVFQKQQQQQVAKPAAVASPRGDEAAYERV